MAFVRIEIPLERRDAVPLGDIVSEPILAEIAIKEFAIDKERRMAFIQIENQSYPDLEVGFLLLIGGRKVTVHHFPYLSNGYWELTWRPDKGISRAVESSINEAIYEAAICMGIPGAKGSQHPMKVRGLIRSSQR